MRSAASRHIPLRLVRPSSNFAAGSTDFASGGFVRSNCSPSRQSFLTGRRPDHSRSYMQKYWRTMHGPLVVHGEGLDDPFPVIRGGSPDLIQYRQWHTIEDITLNNGRQWEGGAMTWRPTDTTNLFTTGNSRDILIEDEARFIDLPASVSFRAMARCRISAIESKL